MRVRLRFSKLGKIRFTSQRDVARMWERALRRDRFPVAYSGGFSPRPQLSFGLALPTGCESLAEYLDVTVDDRRTEAAGLDVGSCPERLTALLPEGITVTSAALLGDGEPSLQEAVTSCRWVIALCGAGRDEIARRLAAAMAADHLPVARRRKGQDREDDLRPSILSLEVAAANDGNDPSDLNELNELNELNVRNYGEPVDVVAELATRPRGVRPAELLAALAAAHAPGAGTAPAAGDDHAGLRLRRACRTNQWIECDGTRCEPLPEGGTGRSPHCATPAERCAS